MALKWNPATGQYFEDGTSTDATAPAAPATPKPAPVNNLNLSGGLTAEDVAQATALYSTGKKVHGMDPNADVIGQAKLIRDARIKKEAEDAAAKAAADQVARDAAAKAAIQTQNTANTQAATNQLTSVAAGGQDAANYVNSLVPGAVGYQPPGSNYAPPAPAFDQTAAAKQIGKIQYGAFGMTNQQVDELNLKLQGQANPGRQVLETGMGTDNSSFVQNPNYRPGAPNQQPVPYGYTGPLPTGAVAGAPGSASMQPGAQPATIYAQPQQPPPPATQPSSGPPPATPVAKLTQPTPKPIPSLQDIAQGLLGKIGQRAR